MNEPDMLVVKLLWFFGFLLLFTIRSTVTLPANNTIKLDKELADKYGKLLSAIVALNEERMDTMKKLYRLQDMPVRSNLRSMGDGEVYAVWKIEGKPAWLEKLSEDNKVEYDDVLQTDDNKVIIIPFIKPRRNEERFSEDSQIPVTFNKTESVRESSPLEFWEGSKEGLSKGDLHIEKGINFKSNGSISFGQKENSSLEFWEGSQEGLSKEDSHIEKIINFKYNGSMSFGLKESSSLELASKEILSEEDDNDKNLKNHRLPPGKPVSLLLKSREESIKFSSKEDSHKGFLYKNSNIEDGSNFKAKTLSMKKNSNNSGRSSLNFREKSNENLSEDNSYVKDGRNKVGNIQPTIGKSKFDTIIDSLELLRKRSKRVLSKEISYDEKLVDEINDKYHSIDTYKRIPTQINKEMKSLEFWKGLKDSLLKKELSSEEFTDRSNLLNSDIQINSTNTIILPLTIKNSEVYKTRLELFDVLEVIPQEYVNIKEILNQNNLRNGLSVKSAGLSPERRHYKGRKKSYKYSKSCSRHAVRYCKRACKDAFDYMCGSFKCTSLVKRNYKKECRYACKEQFTRDSESTEHEDTTLEKDDPSNRKLQPFSWKKKPRKGRNTPALSSATLWRY